jgi:hypothetical protein
MSHEQGNHDTPGVKNVAEVAEYVLGAVERYRRAQDMLGEFGHEVPPGEFERQHDEEQILLGLAAWLQSIEAQTPEVAEDLLSVLRFNYDKQSPREAGTSGGADTEVGPHVE